MLNQKNQPNLQPKKKSKEIFSSASTWSDTDIQSVHTQDEQEVLFDLMDQRRYGSMTNFNFYEE